MKKIDKGTLLSGLCMLLAAGGFLANMAKDNADDEAQAEEMRAEVKKQVQEQLALKDKEC